MQFIDTGRVYHTVHDLDRRDLDLDEMHEWWARWHRSHPLYSRVLETPASDKLMSAGWASDQVRFELDAYEPGRCREHDDPRAEKLRMLDKEYGWWGDYVRSCKRLRGYRQRGTPTPATFTAFGGRKGIATSWKESFQCWKDHKDRPYQAHGRIRGEADC